MKKSEINDLYKQSETALRQLQITALLLPYCNEQVIAKTTMKAAAQAADLWKLVKIMCDYMIDDGSTDMTGRLLNIKTEIIKIQNSVLKMTIADSDEAFTLIQNCQAIKNTIKDMEELTANDVEPQQMTPEALQQPNEDNDGVLAGNGKQSQPKPNKPTAPKTFRDRVAGNIDASDLLRKLHTLMDNKSGKEALVYLTICIADGKLNRPTFSQFQKEFPNICGKANYYIYTDKAKYTADELSAARIAYNTCK